MINTESYFLVLKQFIAMQQALENRSASRMFKQDGSRPQQTTRFLAFWKNILIALEYSSFTCAGMDWSPYSPYLNLCLYFAQVPFNKAIPRYALEETIYAEMGNSTVRLCHLCTISGKYMYMYTELN